MHQPEEFIKKGEENLVCKLNKSIYGLKQSGQVWHGTMRREMERIGFTAVKADPMVYIWLGNNGEIGIAGWYVDGGLLAANSTETMEKMAMDIKGSFDIEDLGKPTWLLGIRISWTRNYTHISTLIHWYDCQTIQNLARTWHTCTHRLKHWITSFKSRRNHSGRTICGSNW